MRILMRVGWLWAVVLLACGGRVDSPGEGGGPVPSATVADDAGGDAGNGAGNGGQIDFAICPPDVPAVGAACSSPPDQGCRYVTYVVVTGKTTCQAFVCDASGHWQSATGGC
jgi:hypothetical protein